MISHRLALIVVASIVASLTHGKSARARAEPETYWWRTDNAAVVSHIVDNVLVCSLFLYNNDNAVVVSWGRDASVALSFNSTSWQFRPAEQIPVAVAIGDAWLGRAGQSTVPSLMATADQEWLSVSLQQSIDDLLRRATTITLKAPSHDLSFDITRSKMSKLLLAVKRCRATASSR